MSLVSSYQQPAFTDVIGEVRYFAEFDADEATMRRAVKRLASKHDDYTSFAIEFEPWRLRLRPTNCDRSLAADASVVGPDLIFLLDTGEVGDTQNGSLVMFDGWSSMQMMS